MTKSSLIYAIHGAAPRDVMLRGWIVHLVEVGHSYEPHQGIDFSQWSGYGNLLRIQHAWGKGGTFPLPQDLDGYVQRVVSLVENSIGCDKWIIGNEPNLKVEWPEGKALFPEYVAEIYNLCWQGIHGLPGHKNDEVLLCPIGPWNVETGIDWITYFQQVIAYCDKIDGFALHTYSRGSDPQSITSEDKMDYPYHELYGGFRTYRDWLVSIPMQYRALPVYITETDQNIPWEDVNSGWVQEAYEEINDWNQGGGQIICALVLYRWPCHDKYCIEGKGGVIDDFLQAQAHGYTWEQEKPPSPQRRTLAISATLTIDGEFSGLFVGTLEEAGGEK